MKILLTGAAGQLGSLLLSRLRGKGEDVIAVASAELDVTSLESVLNFADRAPQLIINAAAYTAVDKAEIEIERAFAVNENGIKNLLQLAHSVSAPLINVSTDYVFDGTARQPYTVNHQTSPLSIYGLSKRAGELQLEKSNVSYVNIRTSWLFGENGSNFVKTMLRLGRERDELRVVGDQQGCPTYAGDLADVITKIAVAYRESGELKTGHFHFCGDQVVSWCEFAQFIFDEAQRQGKLAHTPLLNAITTEEYPTPGKRPVYSVLDCSAIEQAYGVSPSDWRAAVTSIMPFL